MCGVLLYPEGRSAKRAQCIVTAIRGGAAVVIPAACRLSPGWCSVVVNRIIILYSTHTLTLYDTGHRSCTSLLT